LFPKRKKANLKILLPSGRISGLSPAMAILGLPIQDILETRHVDSDKKNICRRFAGRGLSHGNHV
jgi:hypothetical protein